METLGTRVSIEKRENGGKILIDFFSTDDLKQILDLIKSNQKKDGNEMLKKHIEEMEKSPEEILNLDDRTPEDKKIEENSSDEELYSIKNFSI